MPMTVEARNYMLDQRFGTGAAAALEATATAGPATGYKDSPPVEEPEAPAAAGGGGGRGGPWMRVPWPLPAAKLPVPEARTGQAAPLVAVGALGLAAGRAGRAGAAFGLATVGCLGQAGGASGRAGRAGDLAAAAELGAAAGERHDQSAEVALVLALLAA